MSNRIKSARLETRLHPRDLERFRRASRRAGLSLSRWVELALARALDAQPEARKKIPAAP